LKANKRHHQKKNNSMMEDLVNWAVGVKDCRTKPRLKMVSILHSFTPTPDAELMPGMGMFPPEPQRCHQNFISSHHTMIE